MIENELIAKWVGGIAAGLAALYGAFRMFKSDRREDNKAELTDSAMTQVISTLREEVARLSERLAKVEEENRRCEERNTSLQEQIIELKKRLHLT